MSLSNVSLICYARLSNLAEGGAGGRDLPEQARMESAIWQSSRILVGQLPKRDIMEIAYFGVILWIRFFSRKLQAGFEGPQNRKLIKYTES